MPEFKLISTQAHDASLPPYSRKLSTPKRGQIASATKDHVTVGVHFSPEEFVAEALSLRHPTEQQSLFPREVKENVAYLSKNTIHEVARRRTERIREWTSYAIAHDDREKSAKAVLSHRIASVLKEKRLGLLVTSLSKTPGMKTSPLWMTSPKVLTSQGPCHHREFSPISSGQQA